MKKTVMFVLVLVLISSAAFATVDLSGLTFEELLVLQKQVQLAMMETDVWQEVTVPAGLYEIGVDIPAGHWTISNKGQSMVMVSWGDGLDEGASGVSFYDTYDMATLINSNGMFGTLGAPEFVSWKLTEGTYIDIDSGSVVFTPYTGTTFTFK